MSKFTGQDRNVNEDIFEEKLEDYIGNSPFTSVDKLNNFTKYITRQSLSRFLCKYEIFKKALNIDGSIIECGVLFGGGVMSFAQLSAIFEPVNYTRKIIAFDSFKGFPSLSEKDKKSKSVYAKEEGLSVDSYNDLLKSIELFDMNRPVGHVPKVELVRGDANITIPKYIEDNPHVVVSLLYLDFDVYEPTKTALKYFIPRMPKGSIIAFDELNSPHWPGETIAVLEELSLKDYKIERFPFNSYTSYTVQG